MTRSEPADRAVGPVVLGSLDYVWAVLRERFSGMSQAEYLWEPVAGCWSVRQSGATIAVEREIPDPDPAPVTTIAWRLWHIASECFAGYTAQGLGDWPLEVHEREWYLDVNDALAAADTSWSAFRTGLDTLGEDGMWRELGDAWGPYAHDSWASLVLHAQDELSHHGAEIALLRDLYTHGAGR